MLDSLAKSPLTKEGSPLGMEMYFHVVSENSLRQINRFLVGEGEDLMRDSTRFRRIKVVRVAGLDLGYLNASLPPLMSYSDRLAISVWHTDVISPNYAHWDFRRVDVGMGAAVASAIQVAASVHTHVEFPGASLVLESTASVASDALVTEKEWAEALGLPGVDFGHHLRRVPWEQVHAFDAEAAVRALCERLQSIEG